MPIYQTQGVLTGHIEAENVVTADNYLREHDMTQFLDENAGPVEHIEWRLAPDGHQWTVTAFAPAPLTPDELKQLADWVSGQNSDGLGESFEQQDFAWEQSDDECGECDGCINWDSCSDADMNGRMISFDWETNDCKFERVK